MGNQFGLTFQNLITLQNLLTQATAGTNVVATITPSMVPPTVEDEEEYLGRLLGESIIIRATRLRARRRRIDFVARVEALIHKVNGKKPSWVQCDVKGRPIGSRRYMSRSTLKGYSHGLDPSIIEVDDPLIVVTAIWDRLAESWENVDYPLSNKAFKIYL
jgi:hypothetical protein